MRKTLCSVLALVIGAVLPTALLAQGKSKTLVMRTALPDNPIEILGLTVGDSPVPLDKRSEEIFDWSAPAYVRVRNVSAKQIAGATVELVFPSVNAAAEHLLLVVRFESAAPIQANEEAVLEAQRGSFKLLSEKNARKGYKINYNRIRLEPSVVRFEDGTVWISGTTYDQKGNGSLGLIKSPRLPKLRFLNAAARTPTCYGARTINACSALSTTGGGQCDATVSDLDTSKGGAYRGYSTTTTCGGPSPCSSFDVRYNRPEFDWSCVYLD